MKYEMIVMRAREGHSAFEGEISSFRKAGRPRGRMEVPPRFNFIPFETDEPLDLATLTEQYGGKRWRWDFDQEQVLNLLDGEPFDPALDTIKPPAERYRNRRDRDEALKTQLRRPKLSLEDTGNDDLDDTETRERLFARLYVHRRRPGVRKILRALRHGGAYADVREAVRSMTRPNRKAMIDQLSPALRAYLRELCNIDTDGQVS